MPDPVASRPVLAEAVRLSNRRLLKLNVPFLVATLYGVLTARMAQTSENLLVIATTYTGLLLWPGALVAVWNLVKVFRRSRDPFLHPDFAPLKSYGELRAVAAEVEHSIRSGPWIVRGANLVITPAWYCFVRPGGFDVIPVREIVWMYRSQFTEKVNGIVVTEAQSLIIHTGADRRSGVNLGSRPEVERVLAELAAAAPWARTGWTREVAEDWAGRRTEFLARVDGRRREYGTTASSPRPADRFAGTPSGQPLE